MEENAWLQLPPELLHLCLQHLPFKHLLRTVRVCKTWRATVRTIPRLRLAIGRANCQDIDTTYQVLRTLEWFTHIEALTIGASVSDHFQIAAITLCPRLKALTINTPIQSPEMVATLRTRTQLRELRVRSCRLSSWFEHLPQVTRLAILDVASVLCDPTPPPMPAVRVLDLSGAAFGGAGMFAPRLGARFPNLTALIMDNSSVCAGTLRGIGPLPHLAHFSARNTKLNDLGACIIAGLPAIQTIAVQGTFVSPRCVIALAKGRLPSNVRLHDVGTLVAHPVKVLY